MDAMLLSRPRLWKSKTDFFRPFRSSRETSTGSVTSRTSQSQTQLTEEEQEEVQLQPLNHALQTLVEVFPDVDPEAFRNMIRNISEDSRIEIIAEQTLRNKSQVRHLDARHIMRKRYEVEQANTGSQQTTGLSLEDKFRGERYHQAVKTLCRQEFKSLSNSTIEAVLAENNSSYTRSRLVLQHLTRRTWRQRLTSFWSRPVVDDLTKHPAITWSDNGAVPTIIHTENVQLDEELHKLLVQPILTGMHRKQIAQDKTIALQVAVSEAEAASAIIDCQCCYSSVPFELATCCCTDDHFLCFDCIRRVANEVIYGQSSKILDLEKSTIRCFAPTIQECQGHIPEIQVRRALQEGEDANAYALFHDKITGDVLLKSRLPVHRCPFCSYAEADGYDAPILRSINQLKTHLANVLQNRAHNRLSKVGAYNIAFISVMLVLLFMPALCCLSIATFLHPPFNHIIKTITTFLMLSSSLWSGISINTFWFSFLPTPQSITASLRRIHKRRQGMQFRCQHPACERASCITCLAEWRDPHVCFENEKTSLRTAIEDSATAAVARTCPKCRLSFVKASGCNKLICTCGYAMCYICRNEITSTVGYAHFCQHFRVVPGRCTECQKCDLYAEEDEEEAIRLAVETAELQWRANEADKVVGETPSKHRSMIDAVVLQGRKAKWHEEWLDALLDMFIEET